MKGMIVQRSKGSWTLVFDVGRDGQGKRKQKWKAVRGTKADAERELRRVLRTLDTGAYVEPSKLSVAEYLERWLKDYAKPNTAATTFDRYSEIVKLHLVPALGATLLAKLQPLQIQGYYAQALEIGRRDGNGGLSAQTVLHHHRLLKEALGQAIKWRLLVRNPADAVEPPRPQRHQIRTLSESETARLLERTKSSYLYMPILIAVTTGMRRGEVLGLRWLDIDLNAGMASVRQTLEATKDGLITKQPKTAQSRRQVSLLPMTVSLLRAHQTNQKKARLALGPAYIGHDLVCSRTDGQPINPRQLSKDFLSLLRRSEGLPRIRFHDLRHTHATQLLGQGVHPKIVSERLGHTTIAITLDTYSHVMPGMQEDAALRLDAALQVAINAQNANK